MSDPQILVTGKYFRGHGLRAIEPVIQELLVSAQKEIHIVAYLITESAMPLFQLLEAALERGVSVTFVLNSLNTYSESLKQKFQSLQQQFTHVRIANFQAPEGSQLHAKVVIADRQKAVIGSANFSWGGMVANHEIAVLLEGEAAWTLAKLIDSLISKMKK